MIEINEKKPSRFCDCNMLTVEEVDKLEEWTHLKCSEVVFDSEKHNWGKKTSVFDDKIL